MSRRTNAFTLAEMTVSLFIVSLIVVAAGLSITALLGAAENNKDSVIASSGSPPSPGAQVLSAQSALQSLSADLKVATSIVPTTLPANGLQLTLTVPPRYAGHSSETLIYQWNGPDTSLTRQLNSATAASVADHVQALNYAAVDRSVAPAAVPTGQ